MPAPTVENVVRTTLQTWAVLRRVSVMYRTVRYESADGKYFGKAFPATVLEWERAVD